MRYHAILRTNGQIWITHGNFSTPEAAMEYVRTDLTDLDVLGVVGADSAEAAQLLKGAWIRPSE